MRFIGSRICLVLLPLYLVAGGMEDVSTYHKNSVMQWDIAMEVIDPISWKGTERILDVGCGDGKITALLAEKLSSGSILGIDISEKMIDFASSHYHLPNLAFQTLSATDVAFEGEFDRVVSFSALHWVAQQEKALKGIYQALKEGGTVHIQTYGLGPMNAIPICDALIRTEKWAPHFPSYTTQERVYFSQEEYRALLENVGFEEIEVDASLKSTLFASRKAFTDFIRPLLNFIHHLPEDLKQEFTEEVMDKLMSVAKVADDGKVLYTVLSIQARAAKKL